MKLNEKEAKILAAVELNADRPLADIARAAGCQQHTVRYYLKQLEEGGVIRRMPFLNIAPLGYHYYAIYFSLRADVTAKADALLKRLEQAQGVVWLAEMGGDFQYGLAVCAKHIHDLQRFLFALSHEFPGMLCEKSIACQFSVTRFARAYLGEIEGQNQELSMAGPYQPVECDDLDRKLLSAMSRLRPRSRRELAQQIKAPVSTIDLRVKKLEERGLILGYVYDVDAARFGMRKYTLLVYAKGLHEAFHKALHKFAAAHPQVVELYACFGSWDYELNIEVEHDGDVVAVTRQLNERFAEQISMVKVLNRFRDLKYSFVPF